MSWTDFNFLPLATIFKEGHSLSGLGGLYDQCIYLSWLTQNAVGKGKAG